MTTIHCSEDDSNLVERPLGEQGWNDSRKHIETKSWTVLRQTGRHVYVTLEGSLIKMGFDRPTKVQTFDK